MSTPWEDVINLINAGENVAASVTNRPTSQVARRTQYLYDRLQALAAGEALFVHDVALEEDALVGDVVYYDETSGTYKRALASLDYNSTSGYWTISESSYVVGMVYEKTGNTSGHLLTGGFLREFSLASSIPGDHTDAGAYFLSMTQAGKLTSLQPPVGVFVLYNRDGTSFHFGPTPRDVLEDHIHYRYDLYAQPAGDHNCVDREDPDGEHRVIGADSNLPGWLPADDPIFNGVAPEGALFGYNLSQHDDLQKVWPPLPVDSVYIERNNRGVPVNVTDCPLVIVDTNGIWWMANCWGAAPWPPEYPGCVPDSSSSSSSESSSSEACPCEMAMEYQPGHAQRLDEMHLRLWFVKMVSKTDQTVVTDLAPEDENEPILVLDCDGEEATTGSLRLSFDWSKLTEQYPVTGYKGVKNLSGGVIQRGPFITGVKPGIKAEVVGIGTEGTDWELDAETGIYRGELQIGLESLTEESEGGIELVALDSVRKDWDETQKRFTLHFPAGFESSFRGRVTLPRINFTSGATPDELALYLWFWFTSRQPPGAIPTLDATYRRYPRPASSAPFPAMPTIAAEADIDTGGVWTPGLTFDAAGEYGEATTPALTAYIGDIVDFTLGWDGATPPALSDGFGILRMGFRAELVP
jgi:hypothetical protein